MSIHRLVAITTLLAMLLGGTCQAQAPVEDADRSYDLAFGRCADELLAKLETEFRQIERQIEAGRRSPSERLGDAYNAAMAKIFNTYIGDDRLLQQQLIDEILKRPDEGFARSCLCEMIHRFARGGDRTSLTGLLAKRCPRDVNLHDTVEAALVVSYSQSLPDGTLVLCDAFGKAEDKVAKKELIRALRRGFRFLKIAKDDVEFVEAIRRWYAAHRDEYIPNAFYYNSFSDLEHPEEGVLIPKNVAEQRLKKETPRPATD